jgi:hypothetical protein
LVAVLHQVAAVQLQPAERSLRLAVIAFTRLRAVAISLFQAVHSMSNI